MKIIATILLSFISGLSFGQGLQDTLLTELKPLNLNNKENLKLLSGSFTTSDGIGGFTYRLDSTGTFEREDFADIGGSHVTTKGKFELNAKQQIELISEKECLAFNVFTFDKFTFFVKAGNVSKFQKDFAKALSAFSKKPVYKVGDERYTANFMIAFNLASKYLVKGIYIY